MNEKLLFVADLGRLKAFRLQEDRHFSHPRLELIEDSETGLTRHLSEEVTDQAGRYRKGTAHAEGPSLISDGEQHNIDLERRRRAVKNLAQRMSELLEREHADGFYFAADRRINQPVLDELESRTRAKVQKNVTRDLSKLNPDQILSHFCE